MTHEEYKIMLFEKKQINQEHLKLRKFIYHVLMIYDILDSGIKTLANGYKDINQLFLLSSGQFSYFDCIRYC